MNGILKHCLSPLQSVGITWITQVDSQLQYSHGNIASVQWSVFVLNEWRRREIDSYHSLVVHCVLVAIHSSVLQKCINRSDHYNQFLTFSTRTGNRTIIFNPQQTQCLSPSSFRFLGLCYLDSKIMADGIWDHFSERGNLNPIRARDKTLIKAQDKENVPCMDKQCHIKVNNWFNYIFYITKRGPSL